MVKPQPVQIMQEGQVAEQPITVEEVEKATGRRMEGTLFAARSFAAKCMSGSGAFIVGLILTLICTYSFKIFCNFAHVISKHLRCVANSSYLPPEQPCQEQQHHFQQQQSQQHLGYPLTSTAPGQYQALWQSN